jgi:polar amino acid transport system permease protein
MQDYQWDFATVLGYWPMFLQGLWGTVAISALAILLGIVGGGLVAAMRMSGSRVLRILGTVYIEFYRNTPGIVHFFWVYYALPVVADVKLGALEAAVIALATQSSAFYAEVFRGGILSIHAGQWEGAKAIGMSRAAALRRIILPQTTRRMLAPFVERSFEIIKTSSLASTLAYGELLYQGMQVASITYRPLETYTLLALIYFVLLYILSSLAKVADDRLGRI